ncbi:MAG: hypothetical protein PWR20_1790 [Bacteroidales bacterium]|nr:hypothetical protein [Bacteroidales bacterium]
MKRVVLFFVLIILRSFLATAQEAWSLKGTLLDEASGSALRGAVVRIPGKVATSNENGVFVFSGIQPGRLSLWIEAEGYEPYSMTVALSDEPIDLGIIQLRKMAPEGDQGMSDVVLIALENDEDNRTQAGSALLSAGSDVFSNTAAYTFSPMFFKTRGYDNENLSVYMNGIPVNDPETGRASWSEWGGLNDATRNKEVVNGMGLAPFTFGSLGGSTNIITRPSLHRAQTKLTYSLSNRTYVHRLMFTWSTGMRPDGWAITFSGSRRWGNEGFVDGVFYDAWAYFLGIEKKLNARHSLALTVYGSPTRRGQQGPATQEAYDLAGSNFYNPYWGYQNGEKRNSRIKDFHEPMILLNHYGNLSEKLQWNNGLAFNFGYNGSIAPNWYNAPDPRPDYYRYLPSYASDQSTKDLIAEQWKTSPAISQFNWDKLYQINYLSNLEGKSARYILENRRTDQRQLVFNSTLKYQMLPYLNLTGGVIFRNYRGNSFKIIDDLLGANFWRDVDQFAERDFTGDTSKLQNDLNNPNRRVVVGDKFGYNYILYQNWWQAWAQSEFVFDDVEFFAALSYTGQQFWREGLMRNGRYPDNSYGASPKYSFNDIALKTGGTYKITGRHFIQVNGLYMTRAPYLRNAFLSARIRNDVLPDLTSERIVSGEVSYLMRYPFANLRLTAYQTIFDDQTEINSFYHDDLKTFVNYIMAGISKTHQGVELGAEVKITSRLSAIGVASLGNYRYTNRPMATISYDNGSKPDTTELVYIKNFYVPGTPQTATSLGLKYAGPRYLYLNINANYFDNNYMDFNPERRTQTAIADLGPGDPLIATITRQEKLPSAFTLDASIGKSWKIREYFINLNFSVSNILDNRDIITSGFEQFRFDFTNKDVNKFPPKYYYGYGRTFFLNLAFRY